MISMKYRLLKVRGMHSLFLVMAFEWNKAASGLLSAAQPWNWSDAPSPPTATTDKLPVSRESYVTGTVEAVLREVTDPLSAKVEDVRQAILQNVYGINPERGESMKLTSRKSRVRVTIALTEKCTWIIEALPVLSRGYKEKDLAFIKTELAKLYRELLKESEKYIERVREVHDKHKKKCEEDDCLDEA